jgi:hypothetical protein
VPGYSKGAVNRAGVHLAARLQSGSIDGHPRVDELRDPDDLRARAVVEWWIDEHLAPMRAVQDVIYGLAPTIDLATGRNLEVVLLGAESEETLRRTHSSYFRQGNDMADLLHRDPA